MFSPQQLMQLMAMVQQPNSNPMNIIQQMVGKNNPLINRAMQMGEGKSPQELAVIARNLARSKGMTDEQFSQFLGQYGLTANQQ